MEIQSEIFRTLIDNLHDGVYFVDRKRIIQYWSKGAERITGYRGDEVRGHCCADNLLQHVDDAGTSLCRSLCPLAHTMKDGVERNCRVYLRHKEGHRVPVLVFASPVRNDEGEIVGAVESFRDDASLPAAIQEIEQLKKQLYMCPVTGIPNRRYADDVLSGKYRELQQAHRCVGVLFLDIDHFKNINDKYGHPVGDLILKMAAQTLANAMRSYDFVARWGGEEFIAVMPLKGNLQLGPLAERLRALIESAGRTVSQDKLTVTVSIGAAIGDSNSLLSDVLRRADELMYESKKQGRNCVTTDLRSVCGAS